MSNQKWSATIAVAMVLGSMSMAQAATPTHAASAATQPAYLNGGIGKEEAERMHTQAKRYSLQVEFSEKRDNEFIADAQVRIRDSHGRTVFHRRDAGPILLVRLAPGTYQVTARANGRRETQTATIAPHGASRLYFHWQGMAHHASKAGTPLAQVGTGSH